MKALRRFVLVCLSSGLLLSACWAERMSPADAMKAAVLRIDEVRVYATVTANTLALEDQLTADCLYAHSNGRVQTKKEFIAALASGDLHYDVLRYPALPTVRLFGGQTALVTGRAHLEATAKGNTVNQDIIFTAVYVIVDAQWKLASYQSTITPK